MDSAAPAAGGRRFQDKVALVTGSSRGLGRAIVQALSAEGAKVIVNSHRSAPDGRAVATGIQQAGGEAIYVSADVGSEADVRALAGVVERQYGGIDIIVHNAASGYERPICATTWPEFRTAVLVNTYALVLLARHLGPLRRDRSKVLYVSSMGAERALDGYGSVGAAKAASEAVIRSLALEWAPRTQANVIRPNIIPSVSLRSFSWADRLWQILEEETPLGIQDVGQLVAVALWLCSSDADYLTGQVITADGGLSATVYRPGLRSAARAPAGATVLPLPSAREA